MFTLREGRGYTVVTSQHVQPAGVAPISNKRTVRRVPVPLAPPPRPKYAYSGHRCSVTISPCRCSPCIVYCLAPNVGFHQATFCPIRPLRFLLPQVAANHDGDHEEGKAEDDEEGKAKGDDDDHDELLRHILATWEKSSSSSSSSSEEEEGKAKGDDDDDDELLRHILATWEKSSSSSSSSSL